MFCGWVLLIFVTFGYSYTIYNLTVSFSGVSGHVKLGQPFLVEHFLYNVWFALALVIVVSLLAWLFLRLFSHKVAPANSPSCLKFAFLGKTEVFVLPFFHYASFSFPSVSWSPSPSFRSQLDIIYSQHDIKTSYLVNPEQAHLAFLVFHIFTHGLQMHKWHLLQMLLQSSLCINKQHCKQYVKHVSFEITLAKMNHRPWNESWNETCLSIEKLSCEGIQKFFSFVGKNLK